MRVGKCQNSSIRIHQIKISTDQITIFFLIQKNQPKKTGFSLKINRCIAIGVCLLILQASHLYGYFYLQQIKTQ